MNIFKGIYKFDHSNWFAFIYFCLFLLEITMIIRNIFKNQEHCESNLYKDISRQELGMKHI